MTALDGLLPTVRAALSSGRSWIRKQRKRDISRIEPAQFEAILDRYDDDAVFVHAGLSDVKTAFGTNPYEFLYERLTDQFESVLVPGFTPSFKHTGIFHIQYSRPRYGTFPKLFLADCDHRTPDPLHSILIRGPYRFTDCDQRTTFGSNGWFAQLAADNVPYLSVGTSWFRSTQLHRLECAFGVPYVSQTSHEGVIYYDKTRHESITQTNYTNENPHLYAINKRKLERRLTQAGVMDVYDLEGLRVYLVHAGDLERVLAPELASYPYYLVT